MKKSLFALFITSLLLTGCTTKGGNNPSGGGGSQPSGNPFTVSADFSVLAKNSDNKDITYQYSDIHAEEFKQAFIANLDDAKAYCTNVEVTGEANINYISRQLSLEDSKKTNVPRFILGDRDLNPSSITLTFNKVITNFAFDYECYWSSYAGYGDQAGTIVTNVYENVSTCTVGDLSFHPVDKNNGNPGVMTLTRLSVAISGNSSTLTISSTGRVCFTVMEFTLR